MYKITIPLVAFVCMLGVPCISQAGSFSDYIYACKRELGFDSIPQMDCRSVNFRTPVPNTKFDQSNDWVAHRRINDSVDAVFACRWVDNNTGNSGAARGEMIVHNRKTGGTCFFELQDILNNGLSRIIKTTDPVSPTHRDAGKFWETTTICTACHSAGPYIASPQIVGALQKFGLINDGHDTFAKIYYAIEPEYNYDKMGEIYFYNPVMNNEIKSTDSGCAGKCHVLASTKVSSDKDFPGSIRLPSINLIIDDVIARGFMAPTDPHSDYRWLNRDNEGGNGDFERLEDFKDDKANGKSDYSAFYCDNPSKMEMHRVDSGIKFSPPAYLRTFNLQDGLVCYNSDFPDKHPYNCFDYQTRYKCDGEWTGWQSTDSPTGEADNEARSRFKGLCSNPTDIQARYRAPVSGAPWVDPIYGPRDRFRQFDNKGLLCKNEDQDDGKCSNYVVRFTCN